MAKPRTHDYEYKNQSEAINAAKEAIAENLKKKEKDLDLRNFGLEVLPDEASALKHLETLHLIENKLATLPAWISELKNLREIWLHYNPLESLPIEIAQLPKLQLLGLFGNQLGSKLSLLGKIPTLRKLWLGGRENPVIPESLQLLPELDHLYLAGDRLSRLPDWLPKLASLRSIDISNCDLVNFPPEIFELSQLTELRAGQNPFSEIPDRFSSIPRVSVLELSDVNASTLPSSVTQLLFLRTLQFSKNGLRELPEDFGKLRRLRYLHLATNQLASLPSSFGELTALEHLDLSQNELASLPGSLSRLSNLKTLYLHENPKLEIPKEILGRGPNASGSANPPSEILNYYFSAREGSRPLNEGKLILLGRGEVGKTSLVNRLVHDKFSATMMTRGIAITQWLVPVSRETVRMHVWDFGGQEIQHATHQFFLTERSLYLVVLNGRSGAEEEDAELWLRFIRSFGGESSAIVVLNKCKTNPAQVNQRGLREKYPFIRAFVETDCKPSNHHGVLQLRKEIAAAIQSMEHVRAPFPSRWFQIKERLARMNKPFISFSDYRQLCQQLGETNPSNQEQLAGFLNALGIALNFRKDQRLREETILNPNWITRGVYQIITHPIVAEKRGELRLEDLGKILSLPEYPTHMHGFLIELMRKFEICFPFHDEAPGSRYLIPELLGKEQPSIAESDYLRDSASFRYEYRLMPEGLLPRFITRTHTMSSAELRWRTGVILEWDGCRALVKGDRQDRQVTILVSGERERRLRLLGVIRENFDRIHEDLSDFRPTEWLGVQDAPGSWLDYAELKKFEASSIPTIVRAVGDKILSIDVATAILSSDAPGATSKRVVRQKPVRVFISYAHKDEKWRAKLAPNIDLLQREGLIEVWCDLQIKPGDLWDDSLKAKLEDAELYLLLCSTDFLVSNYIQNIEMPIARQRQQAGLAKIVPVIIRSCSWQKLCGEIQALPTGGKPVKEWGDKDRAFHDVELGLRAAIQTIRSDSSSTSVNPTGKNQ